MAVTLQIEFPESFFSSMRERPDAFGRRMRLAAAAKWYELGQISQGKAAEIAGLSRAEFLEAPEGFGVSPFQVEPQGLTKELSQ